MHNKIAKTLLSRICTSATLLQQPDEEELRLKAKSAESEKSINDPKEQNVCVTLMKWHFMRDKEDSGERFHG